MGWASSGGGSQTPGALVSPWGPTLASGCPGHSVPWAHTKAGWGLLPTLQNLVSLGDSGPSAGAVATV